MIERLKVRKALATAAVAVIAAMGLGGAAIAQSGGTATAAQTSPPVAQNDRAAPEKSETDRDNVQDKNGKDDATEKSEAAEGPEKGESGEKDEAREGKEVPGDDGPGGHADEPGNPNADHQFQGKE
ncbi:MAG: hypothetical protein ACR2NA_05370 [Solirubrobacterales bacterium]